MTNRDLQSALALKLGKSKADVAKLMDAFVATVQARCGELDAIALPGFGTFEGVKTDEHIEVDAKTGKRMLCPPSIKLVFNMSHALKNKMK